MVTFLQSAIVGFLALYAGMFPIRSFAEDHLGVLPFQTGSTRNIFCELKPLPLRTAIHRRGEATVIIQETMRKYGIEVDFADAPNPQTLSVNLDDADFQAVERIFSLMTHLFFVPVEEHRLLALQDTPAHRATYPSYKTISLEGLRSQSREALAASLHDLFSLAAPIGNRQNVTLSSDPETLELVDGLVKVLKEPAPNVLLNIKIYWTNASRERNAGVKLPQEGKVFSLLTEADKLIAENQSVVKELIAEGLVSSSDKVAIALLLLSAGYGGSSLLSSPFVYFGGGITYMGASVDSPSLNASLTNSVFHEITETNLSLADGEKGSLHLGDRYPIKTASSTYYTYSTSNSTWSSSTSPTISYEDLGLNIQAEPHLQHNGSVMLNLKLVIQSLAGSSINEIPVLDHREYTNSLVLPLGKQTMIMSHVNKNLITDLGGIPGLGTTDSDANKSGYTLMVTITPELNPDNAPRN